MVKRIFTIVLILSILFTLSSCNNTATTVSNDYNTLEKESKTQIAVSLNPQISFNTSEKAHAFSDVSGCLEQDLKTQTKEIFANSDWKWVYYDENTSEWAVRNPVKIDAWQNYKSQNEKKFPYSYIFTENASTSLTPYKSGAVTVLPYIVGTESRNGVILSVTGEYEEGLCYICPKDGKVTIEDPDKGQISILRRIEGIVTCSLDNDKFNRSAKVIIYHNGNPLWAAEFGNPYHYKSTKNDDGIYSVDFPQIKDLNVKKDDIISIVVENTSDLRTIDDLIPNEYKEYIECSKLVTENNYSYISSKGKPYLLTGIQARPDRAISAFGVSSQEHFDTYIEPYFKNAAELGYETIIFPIHWGQIELKKDNYSFNILKIYYDYAKKYDLLVHLLWYGSDVCGFNTNVPKYILQDTETYSRLKQYPSVLDCSDMDMVEREILAFQKMLEWLYENDKDGRTISIQIENEPNATAWEGPDLTNYTDIDNIDASTWCANQKQEIYNIMDALGRMVKIGPYRCVTRVNFMTYQCYYNGIYNKQLQEVCDLQGIDIVGCDSYQTDVSDDLLKVTNIPNNISHYPEFGANYWNLVPMTLKALSQRAGILTYQLKVVDEDGTSIFTDKENVWNWNEASKDEKNELYFTDTYELKALNTALNNAKAAVILNDSEKTHIFNIQRLANCNENIEIDGVKIAFSNTGAEYYGGCGYVTAISDKEYLVFATRGNSTFTFNGKTIKSVEQGLYVDNQWKCEKELSVSNGRVAISNELANKGCIFKIEVS